MKLLTFRIQYAKRLSHVCIYLRGRSNLMKAARVHERGKIVIEDVPIRKSTKKRGPDRVQRVESRNGRGRWSMAMSRRNTP